MIIDNHSTEEILIILKHLLLKLFIMEHRVSHKSFTKYLQEIEWFKHI